eukprot:TRINITY_DN12214_c2_g1_i2.p1 TRINITY_DN12214_c2_g1~~TRINITY_DN12214_c2_g1_i2.p1  ORF type:complete len:227 (-),score=-4.10 TRINITY_DN12214_c2_g1_i2:153-833(-)
MLKYQVYYNTKVVDFFQLIKKGGNRSFILYYSFFIIKNIQIIVKKRWYVFFGDIVQIFVLENIKTSITNNLQLTNNNNNYSHLNKITNNNNLQLKLSTHLDQKNATQFTSQLRKLQKYLLHLFIQYRKQQMLFLQTSIICMHMFLLVCMHIYIYIYYAIIVCFMVWNSDGDDDGGINLQYIFAVAKLVIGSILIWYNFTYLVICIKFFSCLILIMCMYMCVCIKYI